MYSKAVYYDLERERFLTRLLEGNQGLLILGSTAAVLAIEPAAEILLEPIRASQQSTASDLASALFVLREAVLYVSGHPLRCGANGGWRAVISGSCGCRRACVPSEAAAAATWRPQRRTRARQRGA